jgi:hypothetical protein
MKILIWTIPPVLFGVGAKLGGLVVGGWILRPFAAPCPSGSFPGAETGLNPHSPFVGAKYRPKQPLSWRHLDLAPF